MKINSLLTSVFFMITLYISAQTGSITGNVSDSTSTIAQINWVNMFPALGTTPDARLNVGSVAASGASFLDPKFESASINELTISELVLYPNPTNANATIRFESQNTENVLVVVSNQMGQQVITISADMMIGMNVIDLPTADLANGLYTVQVKSDNGQLLRKLIVQK